MSNKADGRTSVYIYLYGPSILFTYYESVWNDALFTKACYIDPVYLLRVTYLPIAYKTSYK